MNAIALVGFNDKDTALIKRKLYDEYHLIHLKHEQIDSRGQSYPRIVLIGTNESLHVTKQTIQKIKKESPFTHFIYCDESPKVSTVVTLIKEGVSDVVQLPSFTAELRWVIEKTQEYAVLEKASLKEGTTEDVRICKDTIAQRRCEGKAVSLLELGQFFPLKKGSSEKPCLPPTVLLVEDNDIIRQGYSQIIQKCCTVIEAINIKEAIQQVKSQSIHVVVLDIRLPDGSGDNVISTIKKLQPNSEILIMTAYRDIELVTRTIKAGAYDYLVKSSDLTLLRSKLAQSLQRVYFKEVIALQKGTVLN